RHVGVLLNRRLYEGIRKGTTGHEVLSLYEESGKVFGIKPCYFKLSNIQWEDRKVSAYMRSDDAYQLREIELPSVIHNRAIYRKPSAARKLERLVHMGVQLFNHCNRYPKLTIQKLLMQDEDLRLSLPETERATISSIRKMMTRHHALILKPNRGSIGRGIMKLQQNDNGKWTLISRNTAKASRRTWIRQAASGERLPLRL